MCDGLCVMGNTHNGLNQGPVPPPPPPPLLPESASFWSQELHAEFTKEEALASDVHFYQEAPCHRLTR